MREKAKIGAMNRSNEEKRFMGLHATVRNFRRSASQRGGSRTGLAPRFNATVCGI
jgi:hypothetical protein